MFVVLSNKNPDLTVFSSFTNDDLVEGESHKLDQKNS
jgi:hypothetical protein